MAMQRPEVQRESPSQHAAILARSDVDVNQGRGETLNRLVDSPVRRAKTGGKSLKEVRAMGLIAHPMHKIFFYRSPWALVMLTTLLLAGNGCQSNKASQAGSPSESPMEWDKFVDGFLEDYFRANPDFAARAGRHEFDGKLPDWSAAGLARTISLLHGARAKSQAFKLAPAEAVRQFERDYLLVEIDRDLFFLEKAQWPHKNPYFYTSATLDPSMYLTRPYAPLEKRLEAFLVYLGEVPRAVEQMKANLRPPLPSTYVALAVKQFAGLADFLDKDVPPVFAEVFTRKPALKEQFDRLNPIARDSFRSAEKWFGAVSQTESFALGEDLFKQMLWDIERVDIPLDRLQAMGQADLERNSKALVEACAQFAPGQSISDALKIVKNDKPEGGPVSAARVQLKVLKDFLKQSELISIPGTEEAMVAEAPPFQRWNGAYIDTAGPYDRGLPSFYYIAPPDPSWSKAEQMEYIPDTATLLFTSVHEVWPGHFLQFLHSNRSQSRVGRLFVGYAFAEGWAHYSEELMWEAGLGNNDPKIHAGQLLEALLRNVRFISAIGLHTGKMTVAESEELFREKAFADSGTAKQQAARGTFDPEYLDYTMGKLMIRDLREEWTRARGGRKAWRQFHDQFLSYGGPPLTFIRKAMLPDDQGQK